MDVDAVVAELYGLDPGEFTKARDGYVRQARAEKDTGAVERIKGLRRPSTAAWALNHMARQRPDEVARLVELGASLRDAQDRLAGEELRALGRQRQQVVTALAREVRSLAAGAGQVLSDQVVKEVESTLDAALADPDAGRALTSGTLVRGLDYAGLGLGEAGPTGGLPPAAPDRQEPDVEETARAARREEAERVLHTAEREAERERRLVEQAESRRRGAQGRVDEHRDRVAEIDARLAGARAELAAAEEQLRAADADLEEARRRGHAAETTREEARRALAGTS